MAVTLKKVPDQWPRTGQQGYALVLDALEPGDKVAMVTAHNYRRETGVSVFTVVKLTNTQVVATGRGGRETRFRREDGSEVGQSRWDRLTAMFAPETLTALEAERVRRFWRDMDLIRKDPDPDHTGYPGILADVAKVTAQAQKDLAEIRNAGKEWEVACAAAA